MVDIPANTNTTASVTLGQVYSGTIDFEGDEDWVAVTLEAGVTYAFNLEGAPSGDGTLIDPFITGLFDADGTDLLRSDDDGGTGRNSRLVFTPSEGGTYYVQLGNWIDTSPNGEDPTGTYKFSYELYEAEPATPTTAAVAEQVENSGETGVDALLGGGRYQNITGAETTTVTFSIPTTGSVFSTSENDYGPSDGDGEPWNGIQYLNASERAIFRDALGQIENFAGVTFEEVADNASSAGTVRIAWTGLADEDAAAWAYLPSGSVLAGDIWVLSENQETGGEGSYFQLVVLHELGHAMGLKHTFDTDGSGVVMPSEYDGLEYTVMSYNTSILGENIQGADFYPTTYMYWDIKALQYLYGEIETATGDDSYIFANGSRYYETVWDTDGTDTYDASGQTTDVMLDLTPGSWSNVGTTITLFTALSTREKIETVYTPPEITIENAIGGAGDDTLLGNDANNELTGSAGDDTLTGGAGADTFIFGSGWGLDIVTDFEVGTDSLDMEGAALDFDDAIIAASGSGALISDGNGNQITLTGVDAANISRGDFGASGAGTAASDAVYATAGGDRIQALAGDDTVDARAGDDFVSGAAGNDQLIGGAGSDEIYAGDGNDLARGDAGNDILGGGAGDDLLIGGTSSRGLFSYASSGDDGSDTLFGGAGTDTLVGGSWTDDGDDVVEASEVSGSDTDSGNVIWAGSGDDFVYGAGGRDTLGGGEGNDNVNGFAGNDVIYGGAGTATVSNDTLSGGDGTDQLFGSFGDDVLSGDGGSDILYGGDDDDSVSGGAGNDTLWGSNGADTVSGDAGNDTINGGNGDDLLTGGDGADRFNFGAAAGDDTISDFDVTLDILALNSTSTDFTNLADVQAAATATSQGGEAGLLIDVGAGSSIFLTGFDLDDLASMNIVY